MIEKARKEAVKTLEHLLHPGRIGKMETSNRLIMPPMGTALGNEDSTVSEANLAYMRRRAQSGAGLIITEITEVHPLGSASPRCLGVWDDRFIPGLSRLADVVHAQGAKVAMQLHHCGRESLFQTRRRTAVAPSAVPSYIFGVLGTPREMTLDDIQETIAAFGAAARRAKTAGFDGVEVHGAHGYLLMQFLSAHSNRRADVYGGDFRGRARFMIDCIREVRGSVGEDFPVSVRVSGEEGIKNGYSIEDMQRLVPELVSAGADLINVSFGTHGNAQLFTDAPNPSAPAEYPSGFKASLARKVKEVASVPVAAVGRFTDPYAMNDAIARGDADFVAVARQHLADPDFLKNALEGHPEDTCECLACNQGCIERLTLERQTIRCAINPETGQELLYPRGPAKASRNVWVIGGGPAGLTAAFEAARLGHRVTLFEKEKETGGQITFAEKAPHKEVYGKWVRTLTSKCRKQGVEIQTGTEVSAAMIDAGKPDAVILAAGAEKADCQAEGISISIVCDAWQILNGEVKPKDQVVIVGGGLVGMETADFLCQRGVKDVTLVEMLKNPPVQPISTHGTMLHRRLAAAGARLMFNTRLNRIEEGAVIVSSDGNETKLEPVNQVIVAVGVTPRQELREILSEKNICHFVVGDAREPRRIIEATTEGAKAAWEI